MKDLKVGDEKWVIACRKTKNKLEFFPLLVEIYHVSKHKGGPIQDEYEYFMIYGKYQSKGQTKETGRIFAYYENKLDCQGAIEDKLNKFFNTELKNHPHFVMV